MSLQSINTNIGASIALASLNSTSSSLQAAQKQISTGYRVADATDDGGAYAVAQNVRSDVSALTSVNQQLGTAQGLVGTALTSLNNISNSLSQANTGANALLVKIADGSISDSQRNQYITQFNQVVSSVANAVDGSTYNGETLVGSTAGTPVAGAAKQVINNESGSTSTLHGEDNSGTAAALAALIGETFTRSASGADTFTAVTASAAQTAAAAAIAAGGGFSAIQTQIGNQLNQAGADSNYLGAQVTFNTSKISSLNAGLGALVDADLSQESAVLQSLQIKQQLGTQALSIANQAPQSLLSLFK